jgi:hypothetical protein
MWLDEETACRRLYPKSSADASDFIGERLLTVDRPNMLDHTVGKYYIKCPILILKVAAVSNYCFDPALGSGTI